MQYVAPHHRIDHARGKDVDQQVAKALGLGLDELRDIAATREQHTGSGLGEIDNRQAQEERNRGDDLKIKQSLAAHSADLLQVAATGDADDQGREDERRDDRLDQI